MNDAVHSSGACVATVVRRGRRRGFTFVELMIAAMITAMTMTAAAAMVSAISNAAVGTKEARNQKKSGRILVDRVATYIRTARAIGEVQADGVVLWDRDRNSDDRVNLHELSYVKYSPQDRVVRRFRTVGNSDADVGPELTTAQFGSIQAVVGLAGSYTIEDTVIGENIDSFVMTGYPEKTETRVVNFEFQVAGEIESLAFRESVTPRAPADYLFEPKARLAPDRSGMPVRRKEVSRWTGWADIQNKQVRFPD